MPQSDPQQSAVEAVIFTGLTIVIGYGYYGVSIPWSDVAFSVAYSLYIWWMNWIRFDCNRLARQQGIPHTTLGRSQFLEATGFQIYMGTAIVASVLLPLLLVTVPTLGLSWSSTIFGLEDSARAAAPHLFLILAQVAMEQATNRPWVHDLPRIAVPLGFSVWREFTLWTWVETMWHLYQIADTTNSTTQMMVGGATALAAFNWIFYTYNLFFFLIMRMTPVYLDPKQSPDPTVEWIGYLWPSIEDPEEDKEEEMTNTEKPASYRAKTE